MKQEEEEERIELPTMIYDEPQAFSEYIYFDSVIHFNFRATS